VFIEFLLSIFRFITQFDSYLEMMVTNYGVLVYLILFIIVFCETGLVVTPLLPGDSLLFVAGAFACRGLLFLPLLVPLVVMAAIAGDSANYFIGKYFGEKFFKDNSRFLKKSYIEKTNMFYERYGAKTIVLCRFVPIIRTFAPFIAGLGRMNLAQYMLFNVIGALLWVTTFLCAGYLFGDLPVVRESMTLLILGVIGLSVLPLIWTFVKESGIFCGSSKS